MALNQEFLALYYQADLSEIKRCLTKTATIHKTTATKVTKIVIDATEIKLGLLPYEVILPMISELPIKSILSLCETSRRFAAICDDNRVWKFLLKRDYGVVWTKRWPRKEYIRRWFSPMVSCGDNITGFITRDKELYMWGYNDNGQLGTGEKTYKHIWEPQFIFKCIQISCGSNFAGAITAKGELFMWGKNCCSQLGATGTIVSKSTPTLIKIKGNPKISQVSCGSSHTGAVTEDGRLYMWGDNDYGQLGDILDAVRRKTEGGTMLIMEGISQVSCGTGFTAAVTKEGKLYTWGDNRWGQLGDDTIVNKSTPTLIKIKGNPWITQVSCGNHHVGAVTAENKLYMWGWNRNGQLGDGTNINKSKPTLIKIKRKIAQVSCGNNFTGAVTTIGKLYMWGSNNFGQLGDKTQTNKNKPKFIGIEGNRKVIQVSCGRGHTAAVTTDDQIYTWGFDQYTKTWPREKERRGFLAW